MYLLFRGVLYYLKLIYLRGGNILDLEVGKRSGRIRRVQKPGEDFKRLPFVLAGTGFHLIGLKNDFVAQLGVGAIAVEAFCSIHKLVLPLYFKRCGSEVGKPEKYILLRNPCRRAAAVCITVKNRCALITVKRLPPIRPY
jgi:hypothetical protein